MKTLAAAAFAMLVTTGAAPASDMSAAPGAAGTATIEIDRSKSPQASAWWVPPAGQRSHFNEFGAFDNDRCVNEDKSSRLGPQIWRDKKSATVDAGHPIYIRAYTFAMVRTNNLWEPVRCVQVISFTPEAGRTYTLSQEVSGDKCPARLVDNATQAPPESFNVVPTRWSCKAE